MDIHLAELPRSREGTCCTRTRSQQGNYVPKDKFDGNERKSFKFSATRNLFEKEQDGGATHLST